MADRESKNESIIGNTHTNTHSNNLTHTHTQTVKEIAASAFFTSGVITPTTLI